MFDGSHDPIEVNEKKTRELAELCKEQGLSLEAEVGSVGGEEEGITGTGECADPKECRRIADLGISMLAAGIGNIHGKYPADWKGLSFSTLEKVREATGQLPLVLHGGTGIPEDMIQKAISLGVCKINVNTECQVAFAEGVAHYTAEEMEKYEKGYEARTVMESGMKRVREVVRTKMRLFGCAERA